MKVCVFLGGFSGLKQTKSLTPILKNQTGLVQFVLDVPPVMKYGFKCCASHSLSGHFDKTVNLYLASTCQGEGVSFV